MLAYTDSAKAVDSSEQDTATAGKQEIYTSVLLAPSGFNFKPLWGQSPEAVWHEIWVSGFYDFETNKKTMVTTVWFYNYINIT